MRFHLVFWCCRVPLQMIWALFWVGVRHLELLAKKAQEIEVHLDAVERDAEHLLALRFRDVIADAPLRPMAEVAPLVRRSANQ